MAPGKSPRKSIERVLVANRGEIAVRVMRTLREMDIESVAVYSEPDRAASHVQMADHAVAIGPAAASESYLRIDGIVAACRQTGADAVHPGYGFLSENAAFARALAEAGITLIGPPAAAMELMGSKTAARAAVEKAGTPVVPGNAGPEGRGFPSSEAALAAAEDIGFPVLVKASAGGGGKGMRLVERAADLPAAFEGAVREAQSAFGDGTVYIERAVVRPRHVEIQVFADSHGQVVHLGERDCSVQRRHQKVIEETPSPAVGAELRSRMGDAAVRAARACDYVGAGTVEFLLGEDGQFYFLEMNTRLQVEHPVTEMVYGLDLVEWQIRVARGEKLPLDQEQLDARRRGAAIECRVYAEDPVRFLPSPGLIRHLRVPSGPYVRDDSGVYEGWQVPVHYDPLLSKLITWGDTREQALARMRRALAEYAVVGIQTNLPFHHRVMSHPAFTAGRYDTGFIDRYPELKGDAELDTGELGAAMTAAVLDDLGRTPVFAATSARPAGSSWRRSVGSWRRR